MKKALLSVLALCLLLSFAQAQTNVGVNTTTPHASAALDVTSTTQGVLVPRMTQSQRIVIASPATGLMIYQTDNTPGFYYYNGSAWGPVAAQSLSGTFATRNTQPGYTSTPYFIAAHNNSSSNGTNTSVQYANCFVLQPNATVSLDVTSFEDEGMILQVVPVTVNNTTTWTVGTTALASLTLAASAGGTSAVEGTLTYTNTTANTQVLIFTVGKSGGAAFSTSNAFFTTFRIY